MGLKTISLSILLDLELITILTLCHRSVNLRMVVSILLRNLTKLMNVLSMLWVDYFRSSLKKLLLLYNLTAYNPLLINKFNKLMGKCGFLTLKPRNTPLIFLSSWVGFQKNLFLKFPCHPATLKSGMRPEILYLLPQLWLPKKLELLMIKI